MYVQLFVSCLVGWKSGSLLDASCLVVIPLFQLTRHDTNFASSSDMAFPTDET